MVVQHNMSAINANRYYGVNNSNLSKSLEKLSSGYAINRAGDNAAGLAVSEKMRAQISGLTQAAKNAQDGISMTQTFEGALTETDSILQRMRSLATQSANGSYDDSVDRAAIQLEYDQLNDELDQIADTDFNGVVVLNGGTMADGLNAVEGKFDYANKADQVINQAKTDSKTAVDAAQKAFDAANKKLTDTKYDLSANGTATEWNTVDNSKYTKANADKVWEALGLTKDGSTTASATNPVVTDTVSEVTVTFAMQDDGSWKASSATGNDGSTLDASKFTAAATTVTGASGDGGFKVTAGGNEIANAVFDATTAKEGDTVTLTFSNATATTYAPTNIGFDQNTVKVESTGTTQLATPTVALGAVKDTDMTEDIDKAYKALEGVKFEATYGTAADKLDSAKLGDKSLALTAAGSKVTINGSDFWITANAADKPTSFTIATVNAAGTAAGTTLATISGLTAAGAVAATKGTVEGTISISTSQHEDTPSVAVGVGKDATLGTSNDVQKEIAAAKKTLDDAKTAQAGITDFASAKEFLAKTGVSVSDSNDASTAKLSYTDNISLQVGARTKDSVNFTFDYDSDAMGDLEADLNCTAKGLGTDKLSLATQSDSNAAIDKIDNAINKVSMVRGTFGALQNRLEHKIDNLNTTNENLTAAESRIRDTDMASEMMNFTKNQILSQASQAMLAQANTLPQGVLQLLQ